MYMIALQSYWVSAVHIYVKPLFGMESNRINEAIRLHLFCNAGNISFFGKKLLIYYNKNVLGTWQLLDDRVFNIIYKTRLLLGLGVITIFLPVPYTVPGVIPTFLHNCNTTFLLNWKKSIILKL